MLKGKKQEKIITLGQSIRAIRKKRGLTQQQLAEKTGLQQSLIARWESDSHTPTTALLVCVADALEVSLDELVGRKILSKKFSEE